MSQVDKMTKKLRLLQVIMRDVPRTIVETNQRFCVVLLRAGIEMPDDLEMVFLQEGASWQDPMEKEIERILESCGLSHVVVFQGQEHVVLLHGPKEKFVSMWKDCIHKLLLELEARTGRKPEYVVSSVAHCPNQIYRIYRMAKTEMEQRVFRSVPVDVFLSPNEEERKEPQLSSDAKDVERKLFLKLINLDFDGAISNANALISTIGEPDNTDVQLLKLRLFVMLENATYYLAFRAGKDQIFSDIMPRYLGDFLAANHVRVLIEKVVDFISMLEQEFSPSDSVVSRTVNRIVGYFSDNYQESGVNVGTIAQQLHMSPQQLSRDFKRLVGVSPSVYLQQLRLERAKQLLLDTTMSNEQIAALSGFGSVKSFYRALQKADGVSPGQFRKSGESALEEHVSK